MAQAMFWKFFCFSYVTHSFDSNAIVFTRANISFPWNERDYAAQENASLLTPKFKGQLSLQVASASYRCAAFDIFMYSIGMMS